MFFRSGPSGGAGAVHDLHVFLLKHTYALSDEQVWGRCWRQKGEIDAQAMHEAAQLLVGKHDFTTFRATHCQAKSPLKTLRRLDVQRRGAEIHIYAEARSFLHHQVRNMVGTLVMVGRGKWTGEDVSAALAARTRASGGETAPACGLYLSSVSYQSVSGLI